MKKTIFSISLVSMLAIGTAAFAAGNDTDLFNFEKMKPFMQQMHPNFSNEELKEMYDTCHGNNGMMQNQNFKNMNSENMMNNF
ncbi:hypothetical protein [Neobacillus sp. D3-1R]|uniref:hypothetical protein n=1 Tax=Neobacillus sp. D3-1R TaxID=3445778 RepID=UPI003F9FFCD5